MANKSIRVRLTADSKEANSRTSDGGPHFTGGLSYSVELNSTAPEDHERLLNGIRHHHPASEMSADRVLRELSQHEDALMNWIERSPANAERFVKDPLGALQAAGLGIDKQLLKEIKALSSTLAAGVKGKY